MSGSLVCLRWGETSQRRNRKQWIMRKRVEVKYATKKKGQINAATDEKKDNEERRLAENPNFKAAKTIIGRIINPKPVHSK